MMLGWIEQPIFSPKLISTIFSSSLIQKSFFQLSKAMPAGWIEQPTSPYTLTSGALYH
jgi:hypothetical protein